ncbi:hypothetical protein MTO96_044019 [Rhipicephalus appendiculatus]
MNQTSRRWQGLLPGPRPTAVQRSRHCQDAVRRAARRTEASAVGTRSTQPIVVLCAVSTDFLAPHPWDLHWQRQGIPHGRYRGLDSAGVPGPSSYDCAPTLVALRGDSSGSPATGVHRVRSVRRKKPSSTSCFSALATTTSAVSSSVFTAAWDFHT